MTPPSNTHPLCCYLHCRIQHLKNGTIRMSLPQDLKPSPPTISHFRLPKLMIFFSGTNSASSSRAFSSTWAKALVEKPSESLSWDLEFPMIIKPPGGLRSQQFEPFAKPTSQDQMCQGVVQNSKTPSLWDGLKSDQGTQRFAMVPLAGLKETNGWDGEMVKCQPFRHPSAPCKLEIITAEPWLAKIEREREQIHLV